MAKYVIIIILLIILIPQIYYFLKKRNYRKLANGTRFFVKSEEELSDNRRKVILTNTDGFDIYTNVFDVKNPKGVVQIVHGVFEHSANYWEFIKYLNEHGYAVVASDNRGHGKSISEAYPSGYIGQVDEIIDDQVIINKFMRMLYKDSNYYMLGHSFGSMVARLFLQDHDDLIDKLVLTGTVTYIPISAFGVFLGNIINFYLGEKRKSPLLDKLTGVASSDISWISYNEENVKNKENDPLRLKGFLARANVVLIEANKRLHEFSKFKLKNKDIKILSITGVDDMVVGGEKGLKDSIESLEKVGYENVDSIVFPEMKHEVLCEDKKEEVYKDIVDFLG